MELEPHYFPMLKNQRITEDLTGWMHLRATQGYTGLSTLMHMLYRGDKAHGQALGDLVTRTLDYVHAQPKAAGTPHRAGPNDLLPLALTSGSSSELCACIPGMRVGETSEPMMRTLALTSVTTSVNCA